MKSILSILFAWLWALLAPALPLAAACTAMVVGDVWSARRLARRLARQAPEARQRLKFSSAKFGRVVCTLAKIYGVLALAAVVQSALDGEWTHLLQFVAGLICFWQGVSILENEATCNPHPWARHVLRHVADKTRRHLPDRF